MTKNPNIDRTAAIPDLLPCPFCGGDPMLLSAHRRSSGDAIIECLNCEADVGGADDAAAIANWNRRETHPMTESPDIGMRVHTLAQKVTPDQVAEMLALRLANMHPTQCPTHPSHWRKGGIYPPLLRAGLIVSEKVEGWNSRGWKRARLTELGERVLLSVAESAMVVATRITTFDAEECDQ